MTELSRNSRRLRSALLIFGFLTIVTGFFTELKVILTAIEEYRLIAQEYSSSGFGDDAYRGAKKITIDQIFTHIYYIFSCISLGLLCLFAAHQLSPLGGSND